MACVWCGCGEEGPRGADEGEAGASESRGEGLGLRACHYLRHCGSVLERFADLLDLGGDELVFLGPRFHHPGCKVARGQQVGPKWLLRMSTGGIPAWHGVGQPRANHSLATGQRLPWDHCSARRGSSESRGGLEALLLSLQASALVSGLGGRLIISLFFR